MTTAKNPSIEKMKSELAELKEKISVERKLGKDLFIVHLKILAIPAKLKMAEATESEKDIALARKLLDDVKSEFREINPHFEEKFKNVPGVIDQINDYLTQANTALAAGKKEEAKELYNVIREHFPLLMTEQKKQVLQKCQQILQQLK